jgi:N6-adenosine-specific RNA methylase IME4
LTKTVEVQVLEFQLELCKIKIGPRFRRDMGDIEALARSIEEQTLLQPIGVTEDYQLVFGERRIAAFRLLGRDRIPARIVKVRSIVAGEYHENDVRKDWTPSERVAIGAAIEAEIGNRRGRRTDLAPGLLSENFPEVRPGKKTSEVAAERAGFGNEKTYRDTKLVVEKATPALVAAMDDGSIAVSVAAKLTALPAQEQAEVVEKLATNPRAATNAVREVRRQERIGAILEATAGALEGVGGPFPVILADPPWQHDFSAYESHNIDLKHYPTMPTADICALPVSARAHRDAVLYLWAIAPMLPEALQVIAAWGFTYRTHRVWDKEIQGLGFWTRNQHEDLLIAVRGNMPPPPDNARPLSIIRARRGEHSVKPEIVYEDIEKAYPDLPKLELFARRARPGWTSWGNQIPVLATGEEAA